AFLQENKGLFLDDEDTGNHNDKMFIVIIITLRLKFNFFAQSIEKSFFTLSAYGFDLAALCLQLHPSNQMFNKTELVFVSPVLFQSNQSEDAKSLQTQPKRQDMSLLPVGKLPGAGKRVIHGKGFKGAPFISKPETILFKDFEVGKIYKKKVILKNVSYTTNYCKLLGVNMDLIDVISISFQPPGPISAGMACDMQVIFQPMINKDFNGEVQFVSAAGPFIVPIRCTMKKCDLSVDSAIIVFGTHVVGQTISQVITLTNRGALGTRFTVVPTPSSLQPLGQTQAMSETQTPAASETLGGAEADTGRCTIASEPQEGSPAMEEPSYSSTDITIGEVREGEVGPFESFKLEVVFTPTIPGKAEMYFHIKFSDPTCQPISIVVQGTAVCVPVWVVKPCIDLKICMFDRLYQDSIVVQTSTALRLTFEVCPELRNHMEILPKVGYIQARSSFNAQLKFLPRCSLSEDAKQFFDQTTGVLEVPLTVQVTDQVQPVPFILHAVITSSDLHFDRTEVDFGYCSIYESVKTSVCLTNLSLLPQDFGFLGIPQFMDVQPNNGFGTLLPLETLELDLIFSAKKAGEYNFQLSCKSGINRDFSLTCRAIGIHPPLELSHSVVHFGATAVGDSSTAKLHIVNKHNHHNEFTHTIPHIGQDPVAPDGPQWFAFVPPKNSEISITPKAGLILPGQVLYKQALVVFVLCVPRSEEYSAGRVSLLNSFPDHYNRYIIPCFISSIDPTQSDTEAPPSCSPLHTLYLELHCPAIRPPLMITSSNGQTTINFNQVAVGHSLAFAQLSSSVLDLSGPFSLLNALRPLSPGTTHKLLVSFAPTAGKQYRETMEIRCPKMTLDVTLCGVGVDPLVTSSHLGGLIDFGYVLQKESTSQVIKLHNTSSLAVHFSVHLDSLLLGCKAQSGENCLPALFSPDPEEQEHPTVGTQNHSGVNVFSVTPIEGAIAPGKSQDIRVTFLPDHDSCHYSDRLRVELMNKVPLNNPCKQTFVIMVPYAVSVILVLRALCVLPTYAIPHGHLIK
uniref:Cilia and flagella associated protein 74 n=1 Tax=Esox lucius TaxID=8010 RepID=A0A3P8YNH1_ESOLU